MGASRLVTDLSKGPWILGGDLSLFKTLLRVRQAEFEAQTGVHNLVLQSLVSQRGIRLGICAMASAVGGQDHIDTLARRTTHDTVACEVWPAGTVMVRGLAQ